MGKRGYKGRKGLLELTCNSKCSLRENYCLLAWGCKSEDWWRINIPLGRLIIQLRTTLQVPGPLPGRCLTSCGNREMGGKIVLLLRIPTYVFPVPASSHGDLLSLSIFLSSCRKLFLFYFLFVLNSIKNSKCFLWYIGFPYSFSKVTLPSHSCISILGLTPMPG